MKVKSVIFVIGKGFLKLDKEYPIIPKDQAFTDNVLDAYKWEYEKNDNDIDYQIFRRTIKCTMIWFEPNNVQVFTVVEHNTAKDYVPESSKS